MQCSLPVSKRNPNIVVQIVLLLLWTHKLEVNSISKNSRVSSSNLLSKEGFCTRRHVLKVIFYKESLHWSFRRVNYGKLMQNKKVKSPFKYLNCSFLRDLITFFVKFKSSNIRSFVVNMVIDSRERHLHVRRDHFFA